MEKKDLSIRIKEIKSVLKLTQSEIAERLNISRSLYSEIENGKCKPTLYFLENMSRQFNVNPNYLVLGEGEMFHNIEFDGKITDKKMEQISIANEKDIRDFYYYFENSSVVRFMILGYFKKILITQRDDIMNDLRKDGDN